MQSGFWFIIFSGEAFYYSGNTRRERERVYHKVTKSERFCVVGWVDFGIQTCCVQVL